jgi:hypothetical protein
MDNFTNDWLEAKNAHLIKWMKENHKDQIKALENSPLAQVRSITENDVANLAVQYRNFELYKKMAENNGSLGNLGQLPKIALSVVTATMGASILPMISSVQPIEEQKGIVYFRQIRSRDTRGSQTEGDVVVDPRTGNVTPANYASNETLGEEVVSATVGAQTQYTFTLANVPVLPQFLKLSFSNDADIVAVDQGAIGADKNIGVLFGRGLSGTVNYTTGEVTIDFASDPTAGHQVFAEYQQDLERTDDLQAISSFMDSKDIQAKVYALKQSQGMLQSFTLQKRFGQSMQEQLATDLVMEVNREVGGDAIRKLNSSAVGTTDFDRTLPAGVSFAEHKLQYKDKLYEAENVMLSNAGRGSINTLIVGRKHGAFLRGLPGFELLNDGNTLGSHLFGRLDGITVIRVPESALLGEDRGIGIYKGANPYEAAVVYSPFMPMAVTDMLPEGLNPLGGMRGAAQMSGLDVVVPQYATNINLIN